MAQKFKGSKIPLGEPLQSQVMDFCEASYGAPVIRVIREALAEHIANRLKNPEFKERYEDARRKRLGQEKKVVALVSGKNE